MSCVDEGELFAFLSIQRNLFYEISQWNNILCTRGGDDDIFGSTTWTEGKKRKTSEEKEHLI